MELITSEVRLADKIKDILTVSSQSSLTALAIGAELVDWAENAMMDGEFEETE